MTETHRFQRWIALNFENAAYDGSRARYLIVSFAPVGSPIHVVLVDLQEKLVFTCNVKFTLAKFYAQYGISGANVMHVLVPKNQNLDPAGRIGHIPAPTTGHFAFGAADIVFEPIYTNFKMWNYFYGLQTNRIAVTRIKAA